MPTLLLRAVPLLAVPAAASASDAAFAWSGEVSAIALFGVVAALVWHQVGDQLRHAAVYARAHAHLPRRR